VPEYTIDRDKALTHIQVFVQDKSDSAYSDLAKGAGGQFRYLKTVANKENSRKITSVKLWRGDSAPSESILKRLQPNCTGDINYGRGGTYLYLFWRTSDQPAPADGDDSLVFNA
jgi:hypothetical protein